MASAARGRGSGAAGSAATGSGQISLPGILGGTLACPTTSGTRIPHPAGGLKRGGNRATPAADGAISRFKRWLVATYNKPPTDLARYLGEFCFRSEFRKDPETAFWTLLRLLARG